MTDERAEMVREFREALRGRVLSVNTARHAFSLAEAKVWVRDHEFRADEVATTPAWYLFTQRMGPPGETFSVLLEKDGSVTATVTGKLRGRWHDIDVEELLMNGRIGEPIPPRPQHQTPTGSKAQESGGTVSMDVIFGTEAERRELRLEQMLARARAIPEAFSLRAIAVKAAEKARASDASVERLVEGSKDYEVEVALLMAEDAVDRAWERYVDDERRRCGG